MDVLWGVLDGYAPLTSWLTARGGKKWKFTAGDRLPLELTPTDLPALMVWLTKVESHWHSTAQFATAATFAVEMRTDSRDEREALDLAWNVWQALVGQRATNFGLTNLLDWRMEGGPLERAFEKGKDAAVWKMRVGVTLVVVE